MIRDAVGHDFIIGVVRLVWAGSQIPTGPPLALLSATAIAGDAWRWAAVTFAAAVRMPILGSHFLVTASLLPAGNYQLRISAGCLMHHGGGRGGMRQEVG
mmetsp:Transcript_25683/g.71867  ORF Transcript_25683/g.71867 Transcript_25683/m.71867 type:complete len:100 (+) Transcript_25683:465-764(+)